MKADALRYLRSITLTVDQHTSIKRWTTDILNLLSSSSLEVFRIYSAGDLLDATATDYLWTSLVRTHGHRLKKLSVHRMLISIDSISGICLFCPSLEELFVLIAPHLLVYWFTTYFQSLILLTWFCAEWSCRMSISCEESSRFAHKLPIRSKSQRASDDKSGKRARHRSALQLYHHPDWM